MKDLHSVILAPVVTEKSTRLGTNENKYVLKVALEANKIEIRQAVEKLFGKKVESVNTMNCRGKNRRVLRSRQMGKKSDWKKAVVTLKDGDTLEFI
ncbi:50S ribosomal protein L23 [Candidatus Hydrogenedentota bacterium]